MLSEAVSDKVDSCAEGEGGDEKNERKRSTVFLGQLLVKAERFFAREQLATEIQKAVQAIYGTSFT